MNESDVIEVIRAGLHAALLIAGPPLGGALMVGLGISILQTLTQVQEMTLANIPKIVVTLLLVMLLLPFSFAVLRGYMGQIAQLIIAS
jgi:flagellar biosynthetic protein FliQ